jgi:hypothetical protein
MALLRTALGSGANSEVVLTVPAIEGSKVHVEAINFALSAAPTSAALLTIESPSGTPIGYGYVTAAGMGPVPMGNSCVESAASQALIIRLPAVPGATGALMAFQRNH